MEQLSVKSIALPGTSQKQRSFVPDGDSICNIFKMTKQSVSVMAI